MSDGFLHLLVTSEFALSLKQLDPPLEDRDREGILAALDELDAEPGRVRNRLHALDRELAGWWSLTPPAPPGTLIRILVEPVRNPNSPLWRIGPVTRHYRR
jgi:hypothetical protein